MILIFTFSKIIKNQHGNLINTTTVENIKSIIFKNLIKEI